MGKIGFDNKAIIGTSEKKFMQSYSKKYPSSLDS